ncbi:Pox1p [Saccharomyces cerevisiae YJM1400]|nr:Pox1p [Saccharomyces cerevisiae YJM1479]AJS28587.1 Pox1p [Saccharomyces cerevisiae YJM1400]
MTRRTTINPDSVVLNPQKFIQKERADSKIKVDQVNTFLESSPERRTLTHALIDQIVNDPILKTDTDYYDATKLQEREITAKKIARLASYMEHDIKTVRKHFRDTDLMKELQANDPDKASPLTNKDLFIFDKRLSLVANIDPQLGTRVGVHLGLFGNCIKGNGTDEQIRYWLQERGATLMKGIYGCFAMTELGHGSNVAQLQTRAVYDKQNDTFIIDTPDLTATKWWIGGAAHSATHAAVYARLIVEGKDYGVKTFVVPLRDPSTFQLLAGVSIGDIGAKMGRDGIDNGWIQFRNVVIPREFMLSRFTKVVRSPDGSVAVKTEPQLDQISGYSALLSGRVNMVMDSFRFGSKFATIAVRYAVGRQQFAPRKGLSETQLIDYPLHQYRVLPQLCVPYLVSPVAFKLMDNYYSTLDELYNASSSADKAALVTVSKKLKNLFIDSASLKATNTWLIATLIDELRQTCGGHGYSQYNGFGKGYDDWVVQCTWEGDNNVLSLTSAKSILKKFIDSATKGRFDNTLDVDSFSYLKPQYIGSVVSGEIKSSLKELGDYTEIWSITLIKLLAHIGTLVEKSRSIDSVSKLLVLVSKFHALRCMLKTYYDKLNSRDSHISDEITKESMWNVYKLFSLYFIDKHSGEFQQFKIFTPDQISKVVQPQLLALLPIVRKDCIGLTDSFELPDAMLNSPIGYFDGDIYHNYFNEVCRNNPVEADGAGKPSYHALLSSMLGRGFEFDQKLGGAANAEILSKINK